MTAKALFRGFCTIIFCTLISMTAAQADDKEREGGLSGTGIVGEITALGSIIVNEQYIALDGNLTVSSVLGPKSANMLVPGDIVAVAVALGETGWTATAITQKHALVGPVAESRDGGFTALGVRVKWSGSATPGTWVAVSGFWTQDGINATRVHEIDKRDTVSLHGSYRAPSSASEAKVGTVALDVAPLQHADEGDVIRVTGILEGDSIAVTDIHNGLFEHPVALVLAEGFLTRVAPSGHYTVAGSGLSAYTENPQSIMEAERIRVCGFEGRLGSPVARDFAQQIERLGCLDQFN